MWLGATAAPVDLSVILPAVGLESWSPVVVWTVLLLAYCYAASVLPVGALLQPRDLLNSGLLLLTMAALVAGAAVAGLTGAATLEVAPAVADLSLLPADAPAVFPFLFVTVACGACSGFHCLVASGTSSKQLRSEADAKAVGYGAMLTEAFLAVLVVLACTAGLGMSLDVPAPSPLSPQADGSPSGAVSSGQAAWKAVYAPEGGASWAAFGLKETVGAFVTGGANFLQQLGIPTWFGVGLIATTVAGFAATTLDSATRLQRYVIQELAGGLAEKAPAFAPLTGRHPATLLAVLAGGAVAMLPAEGKGYGTGGLILWPLFGATNQLLAGLAFLVIAFYLRRRGRSVWWLVPAAGLMVVVPAWAMGVQVFHPDTGWLAQRTVAAGGGRDGGAAVGGVGAGRGDAQLVAGERGGVSPPRFRDRRHGGLTPPRSPALAPYASPLPPFLHPVEKIPSSRLGASRAKHYTPPRTATVALQPTFARTGFGRPPRHNPFPFPLPGPRSIFQVGRRRPDHARTAPMARFVTIARSLKTLKTLKGLKALKTLAPAAAGAGIIALSTGCCCGAGGYGQSYYGGAPAGGCDSGQCGTPYGAGYSGGFGGGAPVYPQGAMAAPMGPTAAAPVYYQTAAAPQYYAAPTQTAAAPVNCVPTY